MEPTPNLPGQSPPAYSHHGPGTNMPQYRPPTSGVTYPSAPPMQTATASSAPKYGARRAKVLYDYEAADKTELSLMADEVIACNVHVTKEMTAGRLYLKITPTVYTC